MHHSSQITVLGMMLTWHPSTEILSQHTACMYIYYFDSVSGFWKDNCAAGNQANGNSKIIAVGFKGYGVLLAHKCALSSLLSFLYTEAQEFIVFLSFLNHEKHTKLVPQVDSVSATE